MRARREVLKRRIRSKRNSNFAPFRRPSVTVALLTAETDWILDLGTGPNPTDYPRMRANVGA